MKKSIFVGLFGLATCLAGLGSKLVAQTTLTLEQCREMALASNRQIAMSKIKQDIAADAQKIAKTAYLPKVSLTGSYLHTSKEVSLLSNDQKTSLSSLGTNAVTGLSGKMSEILPQLYQAGYITMEQMTAISQTLQQSAPSIAQTLNGLGNDIIDAFRTDTRNMWVGAIEVTQPLYMGGRITAMNQAAKISGELAQNQAESLERSVTNKVDNLYWTVVSLCHKQQLAKKYNELLQTLQQDVEKMQQNGVATKADVLNVSVKLNESEITITQVDNGVALAKMALCQQLELPIDSQITLADEASEDFATDELVEVDLEQAYTLRPELKMLDNAIDMSKVGIILARASMLPTLVATGGYTISNPNVLNGFKKEFRGMWNVGVTLHMPIWHWNESAYKIRAAKSTARIAELEKDDAKTLINLQVNQSKFKLDEARKKLEITNRNIKSAEENLRCAELGYKEGVIPLLTVNEAQTAWFKAKTEQINAEVDVRLALCDLKNALGI